MSCGTSVCSMPVTGRTQPEHAPATLFYGPRHGKAGEDVPSHRCRRPSSAGAGCAVVAFMLRWSFNPPRSGDSFPVNAQQHGQCGCSQSCRCRRTTSTAASGLWLEQKPMFTTILISDWMPNRCRSLRHQCGEAARTACRDRWRERPPGQPLREAPITTATEQAQFLLRHRQNEVGMGFRQVIMLRNTGARPRPNTPPRPIAIQRLRELIAGPNSSFHGSMKPKRSSR